MSDYLNIHPEVEDALMKGIPVVALESTIISHGMPWPRNYETAMEVEACVREHGAIPATIAIMDGKCCAGLDKEQLLKLAKPGEVHKVSVRDMPLLLSQKSVGATTVAATMRIAHMAGIRFFATGGTGGVHRHAQESMDVSADLPEMMHCDVAVVSAGVKSILDIGLTLEYLETLGIPVLTYGQNDFPAFYSRKSGFKSPFRLDAVEDVARMLKTKWDCGLHGGVLVANPIPEAYEIPYDEMERFIIKALDKAALARVSGKEITPFLLASIMEETKGRSLDANIALVKNNAMLAAKIAAAFHD
jgi:pseudouridine-5'-phosphate glycosidase